MGDLVPPLHSIHRTMSTPAVMPTLPETPAVGSFLPRIGSDGRLLTGASRPRSTRSVPRSVGGGSRRSGSQLSNITGLTEAEVKREVAAAVQEEVARHVDPLRKQL